MMKKIIIIDGYSLFFRAYYATAYRGEDTILKTSNNTPINAIFTFGKMVLPLIKSLNENDSICVALDTGGKTFRHDIMPEYKGQRNETPESLIVQMPILREFLDALNISHVEMTGYEADDVAGSIAYFAKKEGYNVELYTSDKDYLQLVDANVNVCLIKKGMSDIQKITTDNFYETFNFYPNQLIDYKGLRGDSSDNLKGIPGIGEKTAIDLLNKYKSIEDIYDHIDELKGKMKDNLLEYKATGLLCKEMATIVQDLKLPRSTEGFIYEGYNVKDAISFINKYELKSLGNDLTKIKSVKQEFDAEHEINYEIVEHIPEFKSNCFGIAIDYVGTNYHLSTINGFALYLDRKSIYIKAENAFKDANFISLLSSSSSSICCYDYKEIKYQLNKLNIEISSPVIDLSIARYLLNSNIIADMASTFMFFKKQIDIEKDSIYTALQVAKYSYTLKNDVLEQLKTIDALELYTKMELPLAGVLSDIELEGFPLHKEELEKLRITMEEKKGNLEQEIYNKIGYKFNIASPSQVGKVLFEDLQLNDTKKPTTSVEYLKHISYKDPVIQLILDYRKYAKIISTYINGLENQIYEDGKIHCIYNQTLTTTGRLSSSEPNMQNISIRDDEAKMVRKAFYYKNNNYVILSYDYSQIELRLLAHMSKCKKLLQAFNNDEDIHTSTARNIFKDADITSNLRRKAKAVNFGIIYGISDYGLKEQIDCTMGEAKEIIKKFYEIYPEIHQYSNKLVKDLEENLYVSTLFNRRRYIEEINDSNYNKREFAKRAAMNAPIQGSAADLIKLAMIKIHDLLKSYDSKIICQIHDELIFKININEIDLLSTKISDIMENIVSLDVKLKVDGGYATSWYDIK